MPCTEELETARFTRLARRAIIGLLLSSLFLPAPGAFASYDSFLFGPDEKIMLWSEPLKKSDIKTASVKSTVLSAQDVFNQILVDQFLTQGAIARGSAQALPLLNESDINLTHLTANKRLMRHQILQRMIVLVQARRLAEARREAWRLIDLSKPEVKKSIRDKSVDNKKPSVRTVKQIDTSASRLKVVEPLVELVFNYIRQGDLVRTSNLLDVVCALVEKDERESVRERVMARAGIVVTPDQFVEKNEDMLAAFDRRLAYARSLAALDRGDALFHYDNVIERLKQQNKHDRPQTDEILTQFVRLIEINLGDVKLPRDNAQITSERREKLVTGLNSLVAAAYLNKLDGNLEQAAHLFRRAYLINRDYFPELDALLAATCYDLAETLYWAGFFAEAEHYMHEALRLREKDGEGSSTALDTRSTLGRILIAANRGEVAEHFYIKTLRLLAGERSPPGADVEKLIASIEASTEQKSITAPDYKTSARRFEDALQGLADAAIASKNFDTAITCDAALLRRREAALRAAAKNSAEFESAAEAIKATLWQLAWVCQMTGDIKHSNEFFSRLISQFAGSENRPLADWYQARAINSDMLGQFKAAEKDFKSALKLFEKQKPLETGQEEIDTITWIIDDIRYNLKGRRNSPPSDNDYLNAEPISFWQKERFPLKVFVETEKGNGFGGDMRELMLKAMNQWTEYEGSPVTLRFVDGQDKADVYIERVVSYDDIPYSSAGRTSVVYASAGGATKKKRDKYYRQRFGDAVVTGALDKAHVRVYCPSFDGNASGRADRIDNQKMSEHARTLLYTLFMHEFGHVIGIGHSPCGTDVMYWKSCSTKLSERDKETIRKLYQ